MLRYLILDTEPNTRPITLIKAGRDYKRTPKGEIYLDFKLERYKNTKIREITVFDISLKITDDELEIYENNVYTDIESLLKVNPDDYDYIVGFNALYDLWFISCHTYHNYSIEDSDKLAKIFNLPVICLQRRSYFLDKKGHFLSLSKFYDALHDEPCDKTKLHGSYYDAELTSKCLYRIYELGEDNLIEKIRFKICNYL